MLYLAETKFVRNLKMGLDGGGGCHALAIRIFCTNSEAGGGHLAGCARRGEAKGSPAGALGKGEVIWAADTPLVQEERGRMCCSISGLVLLGADRFMGRGGKGSRPWGFSGSSVIGKAK